LGILIPPSVVLIFYGIISGESVALLFAAGIIPGIVSAGFYAVTIAVLARRKGYITPVVEKVGVAALPQVTKTEVLRSVGFIILIFLVVVVGLFTGFMTTTESAAIAAVLGLAILLYESRRKKSKEIARTVYSALSESSGITSMGLTILIGASIFTFFLVSARVPYRVAEFLTTLEVAPLALVALILAATIPLGMFLDAMSILVIVVPLTYPTLMELGFSGVWYGILLVKMIELSLITPPVGLNAFVIASASGIKVETVFRGLIPFIVTDLVLITVFLLFPEIVLFLPVLVAQ
jgi:tripartite ATP-independent transporter DctM subunit